MSTTPLVNHVAIDTPVVWVATEEPGPVLDQLINQDYRKIYRMDAIDGLVMFNGTKWVQVLIVMIDPETGAPIDTPTHDRGEALKHVIENGGVFVLENAHIIAEGLYGLINSMTYRYRHTFATNATESSTAQLYCLSHKTEVPPEIARITTLIDTNLPDAERIEQILDHLAAEGKVTFDNKTALIKGATGLSESEISNVLLDSGRRSKTRLVIAREINDYKTSLLKSNGILDIRTPSITIDQIGGLDLAKELIQQVANMWLNEAEYAKYNVKPVRRVMLVGVAGCGKSAICEAAANALGLELAKGGVSNSMSKWVGESEQNMRKSFAALRLLAPVLFWVDEFGRDLAGSGGEGDHGTTNRVHGEFLTGLQELPDNVFLWAAANRIDSLPPEMTRADRFDRIMFVGFPTFTERKDIFAIHLGPDFAGQYDLDKLAEATPLFTGSEIKSLVNEVRFTNVASFGAMPQTQDYLNYAPRMKNRMWINHREAVALMYKRAMEEWHWASSAQRREAKMVSRSLSSGNLDARLASIPDEGSLSVAAISSSKTKTVQKSWS